MKFFRNAVVLPYKDLTLSAAEIETKMEARPLLPCNNASWASYGWVPLRDGGRIVESHEHHLLLAYGTWHRILPVSVIKHETKRRALELEKQQGFPLGRKQMRGLRDRITDELLPKTLQKMSICRVWIDLERKRVVVEASSTNKAEDVMRALRTDLDWQDPFELSSPPLPSNSMMSTWAKGRTDLPAGLKIGSSIELHDAESGRYRIDDVGSHDHHVIPLVTARDLEVHALELIYGPVTFKLLPDLRMARIRADYEPAADAADDWDTNVALMVGDLAGAITAVSEGMGIS